MKQSTLRRMEGAIWVLGGLAAAGGCVAAWTAPVEATMGSVQKMFYLHVPAALCMLVACIGAFVGNVGYLWQRRDRWDALALACAEVSVLLSVIVLVTGMIWGHFAWGQWWTWSPRLTFSLILALLYAAYLVLHRALAAPQKRGLICAVYGVAAFVDVPLVYLSTKLLPDIHPASVSIDPQMRWTLLTCLAALTLLSAALLMARFRGAVRATHRHPSLNRALA